MLHRRSMLPFVALLAACVVVLPACNKKEKVNQEDEPVKNEIEPSTNSFIPEPMLRGKASVNLKKIGLALHTFMSVNNDKILIHGTGPNGAILKKADEKPLLSWRVAILPYIDPDYNGRVSENEALYKQFKLDEPWDSEHNKKLIEKMPKAYTPLVKPGKAGYTHLQMIIGPSAMQLPFTNTLDIKDGTSSTFAIVEASEPVIWTKPADIMFPAKELPKDFRKKLGGQFTGGFYALFWDGSDRFIDDKTSDRELREYINPKDRK